MKIRRIIYFRARGNNLIKFVNQVRNSEIICTGQQYKNEEYTGQIYASDMEKLQNLAEKCNTEIFIDGYDGKIFKVMKYRVRYGIAAGFIIMIFFIFIMSNVVVKIEIRGNHNINDSQIISVLSEIGIEKGKFIPALDLASCEQRMKLMLNNTGWAAIRSQGGRIIVDIHEIDDTPTTVELNMPCNVVSLKDAVIISMNTKIGDNILKPGDAVSRGEIIVSGVMVNERNNFTVGHAMADIVGQYQETETFIQNFSNDKKIYTDREPKKYLEFFGFRFPLFIGTPCKKSADYSENTSYFSFLNKELPIGIVNSDYKIFEIKNICYTEEEATITLENRISMYERNFYSECKIIKKDIKKNKFDDRLEYKVSFTVEGNIGVEKEIFIKDK